MYHLKQSSIMERDLPVNKFISNFIGQLENILAQCYKQKHLYQNVCLDLKSTLKPWPKEKAHNEAKDTEMGNKQHQCICKSNLAPEEIANLSILDKALNKAEKTRSKFLEKNVNDPSRTSCLDKKQNETKSQNERQTSTKRLENKQDEMKRNPKSAHIKSKEVATIEQSKINRLLNTKTSATQQQNSSTSKPSSATRAKPTYLKAPFQTKPENKSVQRKATLKSASTSKVLKSGSYVNAEPKSVTSASSVRSVRSSVSVNIENESKSAHLLASSSVTSSASSQGAEARLINIKEASKSSTDQKEQYIDKNPDCPVCSHPEKSDKDITGEESKKEYFYLKKEGSSIKLPSSYHKAMMTNSKLRTTLHKSNLQSKVTEESTGKERFLNAIEQHNSSQLPTDKYEEWQNLTALTNVYKNLIQYHKEIITHLPTERSNYREIAKARKQLEFIVDQKQKFDDCFKLLAKGYNNEYQEQKKTEKQDQKTNPFHHILKGLEAKSPENHTFRYHTVSSLYRYHSLWHRVLELTIHKYIITELHEPLLQLLTDDSLLLSNSSYINLYRDIYSLLCTLGTTFPAIVEDSPEEISQSDEEFGL